MKVKTCEEYVLQKVEDLDRENEELKMCNDKLKDIIERLNSRVDAFEQFIGTHARLSSYVAYDGDRSFNIDGPWKIREPEAYELIKGCIMKYGNVEDALEETKKEPVEETNSEPTDCEPEKTDEQEGDE